MSISKTLILLLALTISIPTQAKDPVKPNNLDAIALQSNIVITGASVVIVATAFLAQSKEHFFSACALASAVVIAACSNYWYFNSRAIEIEETRADVAEISTQLASAISSLPEYMLARMKIYFEDSKAEAFALRTVGLDEATADAARIRPVVDTTAITDLDRPLEEHIAKYQTILGFIAWFSRDPQAEAMWANYRLRSRAFADVIQNLFDQLSVEVEKFSPKHDASHPNTHLAKLLKPCLSLFRKRE